VPKKLNKFKKITQCRLCNSKKIKQIYNFGLIPLGNDLKKYLSQSINCHKYPLSLMQCSICEHFQLSISVNPKILFAKNYTYLTGITETFKNHFEKYSKWIIKKCNLKKNSLIVDVGSNDGTCLSFFKKNKMQVLGVDPAKLPASLANKKKINTINKFFNTTTSNFILSNYGQVDFVTSHNVLAHTENIKEVFLSIFKILKIDGYFCFEIGYFRDVLKKNLFDTIYHEHLDYHHATPLINFLERIGFSIIDISTNDIQGGTLRILTQKRENFKKRNSKIKNFIKNEKIFFIKSKIKYKFQNFEKSINKLNKLINKAKMKHDNIFAYGSPTKASLLLIISRLNVGVIKNSFEDNQLKCKKYIPGSLILK
jgi:SAM-dependent methyltransferase